MKFRHVLAAAVLPLALVAAGCSDDEQSGADSGSTDTTEATSEGTGDGGSDTAATEAATGEVDPRAVLPMGTPPAADADTAELNITQIAAGTAAVTTLTQLVVKAGLLPVLRDGGPFTVFAPVNDAFSAIPFETYISVVEDNPTLTKVLTLHVVPGTYSSTDLMDLDGQTLTTVEGGKLLVQMDGDDVVVGGAKVVAPDIAASNGVIHAVDSVIVQPNG
jgi:uncharacterized surface protein with fasciclin (FAS1) repeats